MMQLNLLNSVLTVQYYIGEATTEATKLFIEDVEWTWLYKVIHGLDGPLLTLLLLWVSHT